MPLNKGMTLKVLEPIGIFTEENDVLRIVSESVEGSFGLLPHRLDCVAGIPPGILMYETEERGETYMAVDEGVLVKIGLDVIISVRKAFGGMELAALRDAVDKDFKDLNEQEQKVKSVMEKLESGFVRRLVEFHHE